MKLRNEFGLAQESLSIAMARGNINQVGRDGWSTLIDIIQRIVSDQVTEWRNQDFDPNYTKQQDAYDEMVKNRPTQPGQQQDEYDERLKREQERLSQKWVLRDDFPYFMNKDVPRILHTKTCNNQWDLNYGHMSTDLDSNQMASWWKAASAKKEFTRYSAAERKEAKESMKTLSDTMDQRFFHTCQIEEVRNRCAMPNAKRTPDIVVCLIPESSRTHLKVPVFVFEVIGKKNILGDHEQQYPGYTAASQVLAFQPEAYYGEVTGTTVTLRHLQKVPDLGTIDITQKDYYYAAENFEKVIGELVQDLVKIFIYQFVEMMFVNFETSRIMKLAGYQDFVAERDGMKNQCEKRCWHFSEPKYVCNLSTNTPPECLVMDKYDPYLAKKHKLDNYTIGPITIIGDTIIPVFTSRLSHEEITRNMNEIASKLPEKHVIEMGLLSRAVRDVNKGHPLDPRKEESWEQASLALRAELEGDFIAQMDTREFDVSSVIFGNILDPGYPYHGDSSIRSHPGTPLARFSRSRVPTRDILDSSSSDTSSVIDVSENPSAFISKKMGKTIDTSFSSPSTTSSTPSQSSTLAVPLGDVSGPSTRRINDPLAPPIGKVKRKILHSGDAGDGTQKLLPGQQAHAEKCDLGAGDAANKDNPQAQHKRKSHDKQGKSTQEKKRKLETVHEEKEIKREEEHDEQEVPEELEQSGSEVPQVITIPEPTDEELEELLKSV